MDDFLYKNESYDIIGACFNVYNQLGNGFLEAVYQECLQLEFDEQLVPFTPQKELSINYCGTELKQKYIPDFVCFEKMIVEIKAVRELASEHEAQLFNYLKITGLKVGLLVNFGSYPKIQYKRVVCEKAAYRR